jgi:peptidoglycan-associated lipoprotein
MHKKFWLCLALLLVIPGLLFTTSCAKKTVKTEPAAKEDAAKKAEAEATRQAELERQRKLQEERLKAESMKSGAGMKGTGGRAQFEQENIYFDFDRSNLKMDAQDVLKQKAAFLKANPNAKAIIEGHCDERGTNEYNLALGDRRADSARKFLENLGIAGARITTVSYGEERPLDAGKSDAAMAKNRNSQFKLQ